jgi:Flp pilus assembly protein TadG
MDTEQGALPSISCCSTIGDSDCFQPGSGSPSVDDTKPLTVVAPYFCTASIGHDNPYPCDLNCLTVTISANAALKKGQTAITIKNLNGTTFPFGGSGTQIINVTSGDSASKDHTYFSHSQTGDEPGTALFNNTKEELVLHLTQDTGCGETFVIRFCVYNPKMWQNEPDIQICASDVSSNSPVAPTIDCQSMVRTKLSDYIAYPLRIKYPSFGFDLSQTSSTPCDSNTITVSVAPSVPMLVGCAPCVSISGLNGMVRTLCVNRASAELIINQRDTGP